jgi:outer membrane biosynthesis protein TonB
MSDLADDIIKYRKGELSPKEMHALEKKALSDPFLAEALEGAEEISAEEFSADIQSIHEKIKGGGRSVLFTPLRIAAGILLVAVASFIVYQLSPSNQDLALKRNKEKPSPKSDSQKVNAASIKPTDSLVKDSLGKAKPVTVEPKPYIAKAKEKNPAQPVQSPGTTSGKISDEQSSSLAQVSAQPEGVVTKPTVASESIAESLQPVSEEKKEAELDVAAVPAEKVESKRKEAAPIMRAKTVAVNSHRVSGRVVSATDSSPMPGVNVVVKGSSQGAVTDGSGAFELNLSQPNQELVFSFIGYEQQKVNAGQTDKLDVSLKEDATQLSEVVVTGYSLAQANDEPEIKLAEPTGGRKAYDKYLDNNVRYPQQVLDNKVKGRVVIEFTVRVDGSLDEFNILKKLGYGCEEEVMRLVKEGPTWHPTTKDNTPIESTVRVLMKFNGDKKRK